jgi:SAM-dependent methyltransferase
MIAEPRSFLPALAFPGSAINEEGFEAENSFVPGRVATITRSIVQIHDDHWRKGSYVAAYANRTLRPAEVVVLARWGNHLHGRLLELGVGAGRILGYLLALSDRVVGLDISEAMLAYSRSAYPQADLRLGDLGALAESVAGPFDAVIAADNVLGGFEDADRRRVLSEIRQLLAPHGLLIFSAHNLGHEPEERPRPSLFAKLLQTPPERVLRAIQRLPRRRLNRRRLVPRQYHGRGYAILNDVEGDYGVLHYYISHPDQARQLRDTGYELLECIDADGTVVPAGEPGRGPWLYYVARRPGGLN